MVGTNGSSEPPAMKVTYATTGTCGKEYAIAYKCRHPAAGSPAMSSRLDARLLDTRAIEIEKQGELDYWLKFLDTSRDELLAAISAVGPHAGAVALHLKEKLGR